MAGSARPDGAAAIPATRRDVIRNRQRLLTAADELASEEGLPLSFNTLAARAGVGVGTVYRHFADPGSLLDALIERRVGQIVQVLEQAQTHDDPVEGLREALLATGDLQSRDRGTWGALAAAPRRATSARASFGPPTSRLIDRARASGRISPDFCVTGYVAMLWIAHLVSGLLGRTDPAAWRRYLEAMLTGFGITSGAPSQPITPSTPPVSIAAFDRALDESRQGTRGREALGDRPDSPDRREMPCADRP